MESDAASRARYLDALYESLAGDAGAVRDASPMQLLERLVLDAAPIAAQDEDASERLTRLDAVAHERSLEATVERAAAAFETPDAFRDAVYFARCLRRDADATLALLRTRCYIEDAAVPAAFRDLSTDRAAVLDATTFAALWQAPARLDWMLDTTGIWRREYAGVYAGGHTAYNATLAALSERVDALGPQTAALERLNGLRRLGPPLAAAALLQFHDLERLFACPVDTPRLLETLTATPVCTECGFRLGDEPPTAEARRVRQAIERGLAAQETRLAQRVVSRLLARPAQGGEERLARFIQVVQASDVAGLVLVLDDALVDFLRALLEAPPDEASILERLARAYPEVTPVNLDGAVAEFRRLVEAELARSGRLRLGREGGA